MMMGRSRDWATGYQRLRYLRLEDDIMTMLEVTEKRLNTTPTRNSTKRPIILMLGNDRACDEMIGQLVEPYQRTRSSL